MIRKSIVLILFLQFLTVSCSQDDALEQKIRDKNVKLAELNAKIVTLEHLNAELIEKNEKLYEGNTILKNKISSRFQSYYDLINEDQFVFLNDNSSFPFGVITVSGYLEEIEIEDYELGFGKGKCFFLVITEIEQELKDYFLSLIEKGNGINRILHGQLAISVDPEIIEESIFDRLRLSSPNDSIKIRAFLKQLSGIGEGSPCIGYITPFQVIEE